MRHRAVKHSFGRKTGPRIALIRGLVKALVENERIKTTIDKAKELRRHVERAVTMGKKGTLHSRRVLMARFPYEETVTKLVDNLGKRFSSRHGGYTRIVKLGPRPGDHADMAYIEFVDYDAASAKQRVANGKTGAFQDGDKADKKTQQVALAQGKRTRSRAIAKSKKKIQKMKVVSRRQNVRN